MAARINDVCDAVVTAVLAAWNASISPLTVGAPDACERLYLVPAELRKLTGRKVWVSPATFSDENASRGEDMGVYGVEVIVAERYEDAGPPPRSWLDARVEFVELVFDLLKDYKPKRNPLTAGSRKLYTAAAAVEEVYSFEYLDQQHTFWAGMAFEFRGIN